MHGLVTQTQGTLVQPYGYTGREYDAESGLYYYRARAYDPQAGVFVQNDPVGFAGQTRNLYEYVGNNPFRATDATGHFLNQREYQQHLNAARANAAPVAAVASASMSLATRISQALAMGATLLLTGESQQNNDDDCQEFYGKITFKVNVLRTRFNEFVTDPLTLQDMGKMSKESHVRSY